MEPEACPKAAWPLTDYNNSSLCGCNDAGCREGPESALLLGRLLLPDRYNNRKIYKLKITGIDMRKSNGKSLKEKLITGAVIGAGIIGSAFSPSKAKASTIEDFCYPHAWGKYVESFLDRDALKVDNLMYRNDPNDASGVSDQIVSKEGYKDSADDWVGEVWRMAFINYAYNSQDEFIGVYFVGFANNDNSNSNHFPEQAAGWLTGIMYGNNGALPVGERPDSLLVVDDKNGDGAGDIIDGAWRLGSDDVVYYSDDILIASGPGETDFRRGDTSSLPVYDGSGGDNAVLPNMVVSRFRPGDASYFEWKRNDIEGPSDLINLSKNWLSEGHGAHDYWANGADHNTDGRVDFADFTILAKNWKPESNYLTE